MSRTIMISAACTVICCGISFIAAQNASPADALQEHTKWTGVEKPDPRIRQRNTQSDFACTVNVIKRDGEVISMEYWVNSGGIKHGVQLDGRIRNGQILAQATTILPGGPWEDGILDFIWTGSVDDKSLTLERTNKKNATSTSILTLAEPPPPTTRPRAGRRGQ